MKTPASCVLRACEYSWGGGRREQRQLSLQKWLCTSSTKCISLEARNLLQFAQILISPQSEERVVIESPLGWNTDSMYSVVFQALLAEPSHSHTPGDVSSHRPSQASVTPFSPEILLLEDKLQFCLLSDTFNLLRVWNSELGWGTAKFVSFC